MESTSKSVVYTTNAPKPPPFLVQGIVAGQTVFCSGQVGADPNTGDVVKGTIQDRLVCSWSSQF
jgi:enamine deaminase RidA (YjgF/YER057c/UK114 family)